MRKKHKLLNMQRLDLNIVDRFLIVTVSFLIVLVLIFISVYTYRAQESQFDLIEIIMEQTSENQTEQFESYIDERILRLQTLATYPDIYEMDEAKQKNFIENHSEGLGFHHIFVVNTDGIGYYIDEHVHRNQKEEEFYTDIMEHDVFVTEPFYTEYEMTIMTACVSIYNEQNEKVGVLCGAINLDEIQMIIEKNEMILDGNCFIVNEEGSYMTAADSQIVYNQVSIYDTPNSRLSLLDKAFKEQRNQSGIIFLNGTEYQAYLTYLKNYNWVIVQSVPIQEITARYDVMLVMQLLLTLLVFALIVCIGRIIQCWKKSEKKIYIDSLTKCNSRVACTGLLEKLEDYTEHKITIVCLGLNKLNYVNETYGRDKGDELLRIFSSALMKVYGGVGFVGRIEGVEFISVLLDVNEQEISTLLKGLEMELNQKNNKLDVPYINSFSYGYAIREKDSDVSLQFVLKEADEKMHKHKEEWE